MDRRRRRCHSSIRLFHCDWRCCWPCMAVAHNCFSLSIFRFRHASIRCSWTNLSHRTTDENEYCIFGYGASLSLLQFCLFGCWCCGWLHTKSPALDHVQFFFRRLSVVPFMRRPRWPWPWSAQCNGCTAYDECRWCNRIIALMLFMNDRTMPHIRTQCDTIHSQHSQQYISSEEKWKKKSSVHLDFAGKFRWVSIQLWGGQFDKSINTSVWVCGFGPEQTTIHE